jgi:hypothetical protein
VARLNHPAATGVIAFLAWLGFVLARWQTWAKGQIGYFIMVGHVYSHRAQLAPHIPLVLSKGYDGQFYYRLALNPFNWHPTAYGITMDSTYRYTRIGYPLVTWLVSLGQHGLVPLMLIAVNLVAVAAMGVLGGMIARDSGRHALWGLLFVAYFGLVISIGRDTAEPLADACMLGGVLAYRHSRYVVAALLIAYAVITNEPILALPLAIALTRLYQMYRRKVRPGRADLAWVVPGAAYVVLQGIERVVVKGKSGGASDIKQNFSWPFDAMARGIYEDIARTSWTHLGLYDYNLLEFLTLAVFVVAGFLVLGRTTAPVHERVAFVLFVIGEMVIASSQFWGSVFGDGRTYIDVYLFALILLLATPKKLLPSKYLGWLAAVTIPALVLVARRHILHQ